MIVIARNNGPIYKGSEERRGLKESKEMRDYKIDKILK